MQHLSSDGDSICDRLHIYWFRGEQPVELYITGENEPDLDARGGFVRSKSRLPALLLVGMLLMFACQFLSPVRQSCRVNMPGLGWVGHKDGEQITFTADGMDWEATVNCETGHLINGQPVRPSRAREILIPVEDTSYRLITADPDISMAEYRANGSHVRIDMKDRYYVAVLSASPGNMGQVMVRYFMGGQTHDGMAQLYCYDHTKGQQHTSLPAMASMWNVSKPVLLSLVCSGHGFILELSTDITSAMLGIGPTLPPAVEVPTMTPDPPGTDC
jgi:hypothetical protein